MFLLSKEVNMQIIPLYIWKFVAVKLIPFLLESFPFIKGGWMKILLCFFLLPTIFAFLPVLSSLPNVFQRLDIIPCYGSTHRYSSFKFNSNALPNIFVLAILLYMTTFSDSINKFWIRTDI